MHCIVYTVLLFEPFKAVMYKYSQNYEKWTDFYLPPLLLEDELLSEVDASFLGLNLFVGMNV